MVDNRAAFLSAIATSEGTKRIGDDGYNVLVGSTKEDPLLFTSYNDHPRIFNPLFNSTAAGRYQILERFYDAYKKQLNLPDFSPASQDAIALQMIKECDALSDIDSGDIQSALIKCASRWASLPTSPYGQHTNSLIYLLNVFQSEKNLSL